MGFVFRFRIPLFLVLVATAAWLAPGVQRALVPNNSLRVWFYEDDPNLKAYYRSLELFGSDEVVVIMVRFKSDFLSAENVSLVQRLTDEIKELESIDRVYSISTFKEIRGAEETLNVTDLVTTETVSSRRRAEIKAKLSTDPVFGGVYYSGKGNSVIITAQPMATQEIDSVRDQINAEVKRVLESVLGQKGVPYALGGMGIMYSGLNQLTNRDVQIVGTISYLLMFALIALLLRSIVALLATITVIMLTSLITVGLFGRLGHQVNLLTVALPTLLVVLSILDCVHVLTHYRHTLTTASRESGTIVKALRHIAIPCLFTTITTAAGFASLLTAKMEVIHTLGLFAALGVIVAYIATFVTIPVFLAWFRIKPIQRRQSRVDRCLAFFYTWCGRTATERPRRVVAVFALLIAGSVALFPLINVDIHPFRYFPDAAGVKQDHERILDEYGYYFPLEFTVSSQRQNGIKDPAILAAMLRLQHKVEKHPIVDHSVSLADFVHKIHLELTRGQNLGAFPADSRGVAEELFLYQMQDAEGLDLYITPDGRVAHIFFKVKFSSGNEIRELIDQVMQIGQKELGGRAALKPVGYLPLYCQLVDYALDTQIQGFGLAFALVFGFMLLLFRSGRVTAISVLPNIVPVCVIGAILALSAIDLDFGTASIAAILLGIVVDDTIHIVFSIRKELSAAPDEPGPAINRAIAKTGHAVVTTTIILCIGFSTLMLAQSKSVLFFGFFLVFAVAGALFADLLLLPALIYLLSRRRRRGAVPSAGPAAQG